MKQAYLCTVKSHRGKISEVEIGVKPMDGNDVPMTKILIEVPTSDFDIEVSQVDTQLVENNVDISINGYKLPKW